MSKDDHRPTYYSGKKPYLTHNYRTMMKRKTQEEYYFHELHQDPMSNLLRPYLDDPEIHGFMWEYMGPPGGWWDFPPYGFPGGWRGSGPDSGPYDIDGIGRLGECPECQVVGPDSVLCGTAWLGQIIPSECAGFIAFAIGMDGESFATAANSAGAIVVAVPDTTTETSMIVCSSGGLHGATCCKEVRVYCCCAPFEITGADTVNAGSTWTGTISPACPGAVCSVVSNSGCNINCDVNDAGSQVTVSPSATDCGAFTVTVSDSGPDCSEAASKSVRINGISWQHDVSSSDLGIHGCTSGAGCGGGGFTYYGTSCIQEPYKYGGFDAGDPCEGTWGVQCKEDPCSPQGQEPPCTSHGCGCSGAYPCCYWFWWRCKWECECP